MTMRIQRTSCRIAILCMITSTIAGHSRADAESPKVQRQLVATVLSTSVYADELDAPDGSPPDKDRPSNFRARVLEAKIVEPLRKEFCAAHACEPTDAELKAFSSGMPAAENPEAAAMQNDMIRNWIGGWKFHKALYEQYGGEVISQTFGPNAVGAYRKWLEEEESKGHFHIVSPQMRKEFYEAVSAYGGRKVRPEDAAKAFADSPWSRGGK